MNRFLKKLFLYSLPLTVVYAIVFLSDPYKVIYKYDDFSNKHFPLNRNYISTEYFINNYQKYNYDAFIFGNSRSIAYLTPDWLEVLQEPVVPYHFDVSGESIYGLYKKVEFVDKVNCNINQSLIILDRLIFLAPDEYDHQLFILHPSISGVSKFEFYKPFITSAFNYKFIPYYVDYITDGMITKAMGKIPSEIVYTQEGNDVVMKKWDELIQEDEDSFFATYSEYFLERPDREVILEKVINENHIKYLKEVKRIFDKHQTEYKIVLGPDYRRIKFNPEDKKILKEVFGADNIYDFSGTTEYTEDIRNFYDGSHYRPFVGKDIMRKIYLREQTGSDSL